MTSTTILTAEIVTVKKASIIGSEIMLEMQGNKGLTVTLLPIEEGFDLMHNLNLECIPELAGKRIVAQFSARRLVHVQAW